MNSRTLIALLIGGLAIAAASCNQSSQGGSAGTHDSFTLKAPAMPTEIKQGDRQTIKLTLSRGSDFKKNVNINATEPTGLKVSVSIARSKPQRTRRSFRSSSKRIKPHRSANRSSKSPALPKPVPQRAWM